MKKILLGIITILIFTICLFGFSNKTNTKYNTYMSGNRPICFIVMDKVKLFKNTTGIIHCYTNDGLSDSSISVDDIYTSYTLFRTFKVVSVSNPKTNNNVDYYYDVVVKGVLLGKGIIAVKDNAVMSNSNLGNVFRYTNIKIGF